MGGKYSLVFLVLVALAGVFFVSGCQRPCVTKSDYVNLFPIGWSSYDSTCNADGTLNVKEKGRAVIIANWQTDRTYGADGSLQSFNDYSEIWPFYDITASKQGLIEESNGRILLIFKFNTSKK